MLAAVHLFASAGRILLRETRKRKPNARSNVVLAMSNPIATRHHPDA